MASLGLHMVKIHVIWSIKRYTQILSNCKQNDMIEYRIALLDRSLQRIIIVSPSTSQVKFNLTRRRGTEVLVEYKSTYSIFNAFSLSVWSVCRLSSMV